MPSPSDLAALDDRLATELIAGRKVIVFSEYLAAATAFVPVLRRYGAHRLLVIAAQLGRSARILARTARVHPADTATVPVVESAGGLRPARDDEKPNALLQFGPAATGGLVRLLPVDLLAPGDRAAPYAVSMLQLADRLWGTGFGRVAAAREVRQR